MSIHIFLLFVLFNFEVFGQNEEFRIVGGTRTRIESQPYQIALYLSPRWSHVYCGGSIIGSKWIVTAAHCCKGRNRLFVKAGSTNICDGKITTQTKRLVIHPNYREYPTFEHDICLLELEEELKLGTGNIDKIELAESNYSVEPNDNVRVTGWGTQKFLGRSSCNLLGINISILDKSRCENVYGTLNYHICAGTQYGGKDACQGDSGGPLVTLKDERKKLLGVVSFGKGCADAFYPGVYTSIPKARNWIRSVTGI